MNKFSEQQQGLLNRHSIKSNKSINTELLLETYGSKLMDNQKFRDVLSIMLNKTVTSLTVLNISIKTVQILKS